MINLTKKDLKNNKEVNYKGWSVFIAPNKCFIPTENYMVSRDMNTFIECSSLEDAKSRIDKRN